ncbi:MAG: CvpA family protein [Alphaproteobacteria bacterium]|nr:MAG: CvpA family protein [Alphaproteobacteria bacterium]
MSEFFDIAALDWVIVTVIFLSVIIGLWRGFVVEFMSLLPWASAIAATIYGTPHILPHFYQLLGKSFVAEILAMLSIFIITVLFLSVLRPGVKEKVRESSLSGFDRVVGLIFGAIRGVGVICCFYIATLTISDYKRWPDAVENAKLIPYVASISEWIADQLPPRVREKIRLPVETTLPGPSLHELPDTEEA